MIKDTMRMDSPAAQAELATLKSLKEGDVRREPLFPALDVGVEWVCVKATAKRWEFDGLFFGQPLCKVAILATTDFLILEERV